MSLSVSCVFKSYRQLRKLELGAVFSRTDVTRGVSDKRRFYQNVMVVQCNEHYEVNLDHRKLRTPAGQLLEIPSEALAQAVAHEWMSQADKIILSSMHLTGMCNTVTDNPSKLTKYDMVDHLMTFLETDTTLYSAEDPADLVAEQTQAWGPVIRWFQESYKVLIEPSSEITGPTIPQETEDTIRRHMLSYNMWAVQGFLFGIEALKSVILMLAAVDRHVTIEEAVRLSRLETEFQTGRWGRVEWAHDMEMYDTCARVAASVLFVHLNSSSLLVKQKQVRS